MEADLVERLRLAGNPDCWEAATRIAELEAENEVLREQNFAMNKQIADAPHEEGCCNENHFYHNGKEYGRECDCWKSKVE